MKWSDLYDFVYDLVLDEQNTPEVGIYRCITLRIVSRIEMNKNREETVVWHQSYFGLHLLQ